MFESRQPTRKCPTLRPLIAVLLLFLIGNMSMAQSDADPRPDIKARLQFASPGGVYDPAYWRYTSDWFVYPNLFNWLVRWVPGSGGYQLEPDLAESWEVSDDGTVYTFHLRQGVQFHGGYGELTADDVVFSYQRQIDDETASFHANLESLVGLEALDPYTVRLTLSAPDASFLATIVAYRPGIIVSRAAVEERGEGFSQAPIGTGAFEFVELTQANEVVLRAFDDYFRGPPEVATLTFAHIGEEQVAVAAIQSDEFQIIWTRGNPEAATALEADPDIQTETIIRPDSVRHIAMSPTFEPTQDVRVRQALSHAIDRELIRQSLPGLEVPTDIVYAAGKSEVATYPYNPERAKELLADAGYPNGFPITIMFQMRSPEDILAEIVRTAWEQIGLSVTLQGMEATAAFDRRNSFDFDVTITSVGRPADPDLLFSDLFYSASIPPGGSNYFQYEAIDDLILAGRRESDPTARAEIYDRAHARVMEDLPIIPLSYQAFTAAWRSPVVGMAHGQNNNFWGETIDIEGIGD